MNARLTSVAAVLGGAGRMEVSAMGIIYLFEHDTAGECPSWPRMTCALDKAQYIVNQVREGVF